MNKDWNGLEEILLTTLPKPQSILRWSCPRYLATEWGPQENPPNGIEELALLNAITRIDLPFEHGGQLVNREYAEGILIVKTYTLYMEE